MRNRTIWLEWAFYLSTWTVLSILFLSLDAFDRVYTVTRAHEDWELDEFILIGLAGLIVAGLAVVIRSAWLRREMNRRKRAEEELKEAQRTRREFMALIGHEMRTPLAGVISIFDLAQEETDPDERASLLEAGRNGAAFMNNLLDDLLAFARRENTGIDRERTAYNPRKLVGGSLDVVRWMATEKNIDLDLWIDPDVPRKLLGLPSPLKQILVNLVSNGVKFTDRGGVFVRVSLDKTTEAGMNLRFMVRDTGPGISEEDQKKIFDAFYQIGSQGNRRRAGVGLGLNIVSRLVDMLEGDVSVSSSPGEGATFEVRVPTETA